MAFDLDSAKLPARAEAFTAVSSPELRDPLGAALLTKGDYSRDVGWGGERRQLGSSKKSDSWTDMLTTGTRVNLTYIREPLMALLDDFAQRSSTGPDTPKDTLEAIRDAWLAERKSRNFYDWRYYLVRYAGARSGEGNGYYNGRYDGTTSGFSCGRLRILHGDHYGASYTDALLHAAWVEGALGSDVEPPTWWQPEARQGRDNPGLTLKRSSIEVRCNDDAFELVLRGDDQGLKTKIRQGLGAAELLHGELLIPVQRKAEGNWLVDSEDRIELCVRLVKALVAVGL